jgi:hypothetical protein
MDKNTREKTMVEITQVWLIAATSDEKDSGSGNYLEFYR